MLRPSVFPYGTSILRLLFFHSHPALRANSKSSPGGAPRGRTTPVIVEAWVRHVEKTKPHLLSHTPVHKQLNMRKAREGVHRCKHLGPKQYLNCCFLLDLDYSFCVGIQRFSSSKMASDFILLRTFKPRCLYNYYMANSSVDFGSRPIREF